VEAEADVVGDPVAVGVSENGFEERDGVGNGLRSIGWVKAVEDSVAEGVEPGLHAVGEWSGARDEVDRLNGEACGFEESAIERRRRKKAGGGGFSVDVEGREGGLECGADGGDVAVATHLGDEAGLRVSGAKGAVDSCEHGLLAGDAGDPVEGRVGKDGVELVMVGEGGGVVLLEGQAVGAALAGGSEHGARGVYAGDDRSCGGELFGEGAVAAAEVEDLLTGLWREESNDIRGEVGDEAAVGGVGFGVPGLTGFLIHCGEVHRDIVCLS
jgi:hypothetical protein